MDIGSLICFNDQSKNDLKELLPVNRELIHIKQYLLKTLIYIELGFHPHYTSGFRSVGYEFDNNISSTHAQHTRGEALDAFIDYQYGDRIKSCFPEKSGIRNVGYQNIFWYYFESKRTGKLHIHWGLR